MKKLLFVFSVISMFAFASCAKEKDCVCTSPGGTVTESVADDCDDLESTKVAGISVPNFSTCVEK